MVSSYGAPLAQRTSYLALHSSLFGQVAQLIMVILSVTALTLSSLAQDVFPMVDPLTGNKTSETISATCVCTYHA